MGLYKKEKHTDEMGKKWWIYSPTVYKKGSVSVKGKTKPFVKRRRAK